MATWEHLLRIESCGCRMGVGCWAALTACPGRCAAIWVPKGIGKGITQHCTVISPHLSPPSFRYLLVCVPFFHSAALQQKQPAAVSLPRPPPPATLMIKTAPG